VVRSLYTGYGITWDAADPFWRGSPVSVRFEYPSATPAFFTGPPFRLAPSQVLGSATVTNPGDVDSSAVLRIEGPFSSFTADVGPAHVEASGLSKPLGGWVEVDMTPSKLTILDEEGTDLWGSVDDVIFETIPPGVTEVSTTLAGASAGSAVSVAFTPRYRRAY
jgi:hypothetical protein